MSTPMPADTLVVHHHDDRTTPYENVTYWPWPDGVTVWDRDGKQIDHNDVLRVTASGKVG